MLKNFLTSFKKNIIECFSGYNLLWHVLAIVLTYIIVTSGFDWFYFTVTRNLVLQKVAISTAVIGFFVPALLPLIIYLIGKVRKEPKNTLIALGIIQAGFIAYLISIFYKALTGRIPPELVTSYPLVNISRGFHFGFLQGGIFWGWPSSHTIIAFAMSFALIMLYPKNKKVFWFALLYAFFIGLGVSVSIHWFSEFVAGAILGAMVGTIVGKNFLKFIKA